MTRKKFRIDVWSDIACPWCYVGKRRLERALADFPHREEVDVVWHAFELDRNAPKIRDTSVSYAARLASKYGCSNSEAQGMIDRMTNTAKADGLEFNFEKIRSGNTFDAHRVIHLAKEHGVQGAVKERLLRAYMSEGEALGDHEVLARLGGEAGLDPALVREVLASDRFTEDVRADEREAEEVGVRGVPFFVLGERYAVSGAQPAELLLRAITEAWNQERRSTATHVAESEGAMCGPEGCA